MSNCAPMLCINVKHATLVNNCYPLKESSSIPHSSELSYLTFYASARPAKLIKVGAFLERKAKKDIKRARITNNKVTLHILKALIQSCHRDLNIFSKYIVRILNALLTENTSDIELIDLSCETFIVFSSYDDGSTLGVDNEFTNDYEALLKRWASICQSPVLQMRYIGHRAIQAAVSSGALQSSNFKVQLNIIFPPLIITLANTKVPLDELEANHGSIDIRVSKTEDIQEESVERLAIHTISLLFNKVTGASVRLSLSPLFNYMDEQEKWVPPQLAVTIIKVILVSLQPQYRYLLVSDILFQLDSTSNSSPKHTTLISILDSVLNANTPLVGISVLEILNSLFTLLIKEAADMDSTLTHAIGGLASQIYYDNQLNDITSYLVSKLRTNTSLDKIEEIDLHEYRMKIFTCLDCIVANTSEANGIPLYAWTPALSLLSDKNPLTRAKFCSTFDTFLKGIITRVTVNPKEEFPAHTLVNYQDGVFIDRFIHSLYAWIQRKDLTRLDLQLFYTIVSIFNNKFGVDATTALFPLLFKMESDLKENKSGMSCIESVILSILFNMGQFYYIQPLQDYIKSLQELNQCKQENAISQNDVVSKNSPLLSSLEQPVIKEWVDKSEVVGFLSKDGYLRDQKDPHGLDLESKLFAEWGSELLLKKSSKARIQITSDDQLKPKLSSPWLRSTQMAASSSQDENKSGILVETLKGVLSAQSTNGEDDSDSTQSTSLSSNSKPKAADMNSLLNELNIPQMQHSSTSLVNPPYTTI
ncbi:hypothetical protein K501DRAFT_323404 [Backusella circina FSU 941]|nr:hypothetical protein K501DRAFT_323404 [Backusella circina FSU 941]